MRGNGKTIARFNELVGHWPEHANGKKHLNSTASLSFLRWPLSMKRTVKLKGVSNGTQRNSSDVNPIQCSAIRTIFVVKWREFFIHIISAMIFSLLLFFFLSLLVLANILFGCYIAIRLGYGPPDWKTALGMVVDIEKLQRFSDAVLDRISSSRSGKKADRAGSDESEDAAGETESEPLEGQEAFPGSFESAIERLTTADLGDMLDDEADDVSDLAPMQEIFDEDLASMLMEQGTESWLVNEKHVETSLLKLNTVMMKSGRFAAELDWRIRSGRGHLTMDDVQQFANELKDDCRNYLESQAAITEQMQKRLDEFGELKNLAEEIDYANMEQSAQVETTLNNLDHLDLSASPEDLAGRLIKELASLRVARHRLRDMQERTFIQAVFYEDRVDTIPQQLFMDENFGVRSRMGLEVTLQEWWKQKRNETRQITFGLLDFVKFGEANEEHGIVVCDKIIKRMGAMLEEQFDAGDLVGIFYGNCFMVVTLNAGPRKTITEIERVRQRCEKVTFHFNDDETMSLQLTCAVTEALATQTLAQVLAELEKTMKAAKKAGRNHTFHFVPGPLDNPPEKVDAPSLGEEVRVVEIA